MLSADESHQALKYLAEASGLSIEQYLNQLTATLNAKAVVEKLQISNLNTIEIGQNPLSDEEVQLLEDLNTVCFSLADYTQQSNRHLGHLFTVDDANTQIILKESVQSRLNASRKLLRDEDGDLKGIFRSTSIPVVIRKVIRVTKALGLPIKTCSTEAIADSYRLGPLLGPLPGCDSSSRCITCRNIESQLATLAEDPNLSHKMRELIAGVMQIGKSTCFASLFIILPVAIYVLTEGKKVSISLLTTPAEKQIRNSLIEDLKGVLNSYGGLIFRRGAFSCSIEDFWQKKIKNILTISMNQVNLTPSTEWIGDLVYLRTTSGLKKIRTLLPRLLANGCTDVYMFNDEVQFGSNDKGIMDKMCMPIRSGTSELPIHEFGISATPDEIFSKEVREMWNIDYLPIGPKFAGLGMLNGVEVPAIGCDGPVALPRVESINDFMRNESDVDINQKAFFEKAYYETKFKRHPELSWQEYRKGVIERLGTLIVGGLDFNVGKKAVFIRFGKNDRCHEMQTLLGAWLKDKLDREFQFVEFYGDGARTVKSMCSPLFAQNKYAIIFASARARMSSRFGAWCHTFIDLTETTSTGNALMQGSFGRACGYNKMINGQAPLVLVLPKVKSEFEKMKAAGFQLGSHPTAPGINTKKGGTKVGGAKTQIKKVKKTKKSVMTSVPIWDSPNSVIVSYSEAINQLWIKRDRPTASIPRNQETKEVDVVGIDAILKAEGFKTGALPKKVPSNEGPNLLFSSEIKALLSNQFLDMLPTLTGNDQIRFVRWGEELHGERFGKNRKDPDCEECIKLKKSCGNHTAFTFNVKEVCNDIQVGPTITNVPPEEYSKWKKDSYCDVRRAGAGNATRSPKQKNREAPVLPPAFHIRFKRTQCPVCGEKDICLKLWGLFDAYLTSKGYQYIRGYWPKEIRETCCFQNSEIHLLSIQLPCVDVEGTAPNKEVLTVNVVQQEIRLRANKDGSVFKSRYGKDCRLVSEEESSCPL